MKRHVNDFRGTRLVKIVGINFNETIGHAKRVSQNYAMNVETRGKGTTRFVL